MIRFSEITLKGDNRPLFERALIKNCAQALLSSDARVVRRQGKICIELGESAASEAIIEKLKKVFGIAYVVPVFPFALQWKVKEEAADIIRALAEKIAALVPQKEWRSFKVEAKRTDKQFPIPSMTINAILGKELNILLAVPVDVKAPDLIVSVDVEKEGCFVYFEKIRGFSGFPTGVSGKALSLLSSGFDSPVASFLIAKRGVTMSFVHFHSYPQTSMQSIENVKRIVSRLAGFGMGNVLYAVPLLDIQKEISLHAPADSIVLLYRRSMMRIASLIARKENMAVLVTGESVGQVASQTLENIAVTNEAATTAVLRPLAGHNKEEIIALAHTIGTYELSAQPYEDCCTLFIPKHPKTKGNIADIKKAEQLIERLPALEKEALSKTETIICPKEL
jgi:thiamine biosynthesis protein ThiI